MISPRLVVRGARSDNRRQIEARSVHSYSDVLCPRTSLRIPPEQPTVAPYISVDPEKRQRKRGRYSIRRRRRALTTHWVRLVVSSFRIAFLT